MPPPLTLPKTVLPTLPVLGTSLPPSADSHIDVAKLAEAWFGVFKEALTSVSHSSAGTGKEVGGANGDPAQKVLDLFIPPENPAQPFWRDMLALTWEFRTFMGQEAIGRFVRERLAGGEVPLTSLALTNTPDISPVLTRPAPDLLWIQLFFSFHTPVCECSGIIRLVPLGLSSSSPLDQINLAANWKAHVVFTNLESLLAHPPLTGPLRNPKPNHGSWESVRAKEVECTPEDSEEPRVLVIGAGQSGLEVAARLKYLGVKSLVVDRNERVGDNWRMRYEALCLHDPVWYDHMPYLQFPSTWPVYTPALKLANWLEHYAEILELNVWTSSTVTHIAQDPVTEKWDVTIVRKKKVAANAAEKGPEFIEETRKFTSIPHVVFATGLGSGLPNTPSYPGTAIFTAAGGKILHSSEHKRAEDHKGKKVLVVGACTSAHDIAHDYYNHGIDVTMHQRSSTYIMSTSNGWKVLMDSVYSESAPPVHTADLLNASFPNYMAIPLNQRRVKVIAELDKELLKGLEGVGFKVNQGIEGTGFGLLAWSKAGGYYLDTGASGLISSGKIKLKSGGEISEFTARGVKFEDGSEVEADVVVFATGLGDPREHLRRLAGSSVADKITPVWGLNEEGEINGVWRDLGVKGLWYMMGNLALCRFHSGHVALQIKAIEEGLFGTRYGLDG